MKRITVLLIITAAILLCAAACSSQGSVTVTTLPAAASPQRAAAAGAGDTASPSASTGPLPSPSASASPTQEPKPVYKGPSIIAAYDGEIRGGYADGQWLSSSEAAELCKGKMTFEEYSLVALKKKVKSTGIWHETGSHASDTSGGTGCYYLKTPKAKEVNYDYAKNPLGFTYLYYGGKLPDIKKVNATSAMKRAVQKLLDKNMGKGKAKPHIRIAVSADIDADGKKETVVNANYVSGYYDGGPGYGKPQYCLSCIIENDGTVKVIDDYYSVPKGDYSDDAGLFYVQNIIDLDGDGISELIVDWTYGEEFGMDGYKYNGSSVEQILDYYVIYDIS